MSDSPQTVGVVAPPPTAGGVGQYADTLRTRLAATGVESSLVPVYAGTSLRRYVEAAIEAGAADVVHHHFEYGFFRPKLLYAWPFLVTLLVRRLVGETTVVVTVHEVWTPETVGPVQYMYVYLVHALLAATATDLVFMTDHAAADFAPSGASVRVIPHGVPVSDRRSRPRGEARATFDYGPDDVVVAQIGYVSERKGTDEFLALADRHPQHEFLIAGGPLRAEDDRYFEHVQAVAGANVRVTGVLDDAAFHDAFLAADVAVLAYREIRQSGILNWCFAYGVPAVCRDVPRFAALAADCDGIVVFGEDRSIDAALAQALANRAALSVAMERYGERHSLATVATMYTELFDQSSTGS